MRRLNDLERACKQVRQNKGITEKEKKREEVRMETSGKCNAPDLLLVSSGASLWNVVIVIARIG